MEHGFKKIEETLVHEVEGVTKSIEKRALFYQQTVFHRFPFLIIGLSTFGLVAVLYGFEKIIDSIPLLSDHPFLMLGLGVTALTITGTLYKKLR